MPYEIEIVGRVQGALRAQLADFVGEAAAGHERGAMVLQARDQSALMAALARLHDLNLTIEAVRRVPADPA